MAGPSTGSTEGTARSSPWPGDRNHGSVPPEVTWCAWSPGSLAWDGEQDGAIPALELLPLLVLCLFMVCVSGWGWQRAQGLVGSATSRLKTSVFSPKSLFTSFRSLSVLSLTPPQKTQPPETCLPSVPRGQRSLGQLPTEVCGAQQG